MNSSVSVKYLQKFIDDLCNGNRKLCLFGAGLLSRTRTKWYLDYFHMMSGSKAPIPSDI